MANGCLSEQQAASFFGQAFRQTSIMLDEAPDLISGLDSFYTNLTGD